MGKEVSERSKELAKLFNKYGPFKRDWERGGHGEDFDEFERLFNKYGPFMKDWDRGREREEKEREGKGEKKKSVLGGKLIPGFIKKINKALGGEEE